MGEANLLKALSMPVKSDTSDYAPTWGKEDYPLFFYSIPAMTWQQKISPVKTNPSPIFPFQD